MAARIAYSVRWAHLRTTSWTEATVASEISGANQRRNGPMNRDVCSAESRSVEPMKMKIIQARTGSQYFRNRRTKNETTTGPLVLISPRAQTTAHSTARFRAAFYGARLGWAPVGISLRK